MREVYLVGTACTTFGRRPGVSIRDLTSEIVEAVFADVAGAEGADIESVWFGNCFMQAQGQPNIKGHTALIDVIESGQLPRWVPITNVEGACATAAYALRGAVMEVAAEECELALAMGVEKMSLAPGTVPDIFDHLAGATDNLSGDRLIDLYTDAAAAQGLSLRFERGASMFMQTYALQTHQHMAKYGTTAEQIALACAKNHQYGSLNPLAQYRFSLTAEEVLADRMVAAPLTRSMCAPIGDGAAAALVCSSEWLRRQPDEVRRRAVKISGIGVASGGYLRSAGEDTLTRIAAERAYSRAGITPGQIDVAEIHDAVSASEIMQVEMLGLCDVGEGGPFVESGATGPGGVVPVNTSGGLVSKGHPVGATGLSMIYELAAQLRNEAGPRQVAGAKVAVAENGGGTVGFEEATCVVTVLEAVS